MFVFLLEQKSHGLHIHFPDRLDSLTQSYNLDTHSPVSRSLGLGFILLFSLPINNSHKNPKPHNAPIFFDILFSLRLLNPHLFISMYRSSNLTNHKKNPSPTHPQNPLTGLPSPVQTSFPRRKKQKRKILTPVGPPRSVRCPRLTLF